MTNVIQDIKPDNPADKLSDKWSSPIGRRGVVSVDPFVREITAENLRIGKQLLTPDGWQDIYGLVVFEDSDQVSVFTPNRPDDTTDGWRFSFGDIVRTRLVPTAEQEYKRKRRERLARKQARRLAMAAAECPSWCVEHYDAKDENGDQRSHAGPPESVTGEESYSGKPAELGFWLERYDDHETGEVETVGVLEVRPHPQNINLTPAALRKLAERLNSLADRAELHR